jgi:anti-sigma-K factor RskA
VNIHEYISSGILEAYALGELSEKESSEVAKNLALYPELREELSLIENAQEKLLMQSAIRPRAAVKNMLFAKIDDHKKEAKVVPINPARHTSPWKWAAAASVTVALIASYLAFDYRSQLLDTRTQLAEAQATNQRIAEQYNQVNQRLDQIETDLNITSNPDFRRVAMTSPAPVPDGSLATVYWNQKTSEVYLDIQNLKEISKDNQFQLWAIIDGKPVDAGVFDADMAGLIKMKKIGTGAAMFAVTIEPRGGQESPTLSTMQVAGKVAG